MSDHCVGAVPRRRWLVARMGANINDSTSTPSPAYVIRPMGRCLLHPDLRLHAHTERVDHSWEGEEIMKHRIITIATLTAAWAAAACSDATTPPPFAADPLENAVTAQASAFQRYVSIGTSISMGWQSDGLIAADQFSSWPGQLARLAGIPMTQPYIDGTGCRSPLVAPLASGKRLSGEAAGAPSGSLSCAALKPGIDLPTRNVAISGSTTWDALNQTPQTITDPFSAKLYDRVLAPGQTQVTAALFHRPTFVSIELGANEVINARSGIAIPGVTIVPFAQWAPVYSALVAAVAQKVKRGVLVGLINDVGTFPSFRTGSEIFADRLTLLGAFHVAVSPDCDASNNLIFTTVRIPTAVVAGLTNRAGNLPPFVFSCADGGATKQDFVLTPTEAAVVNSAMAAMNAHVRATADKYHFAAYNLEELFGMPNLKPPFNSVQFMTSAQPYGSYMSLDGIHPGAQGHTVLASAAARVINRRYGFGLPTSTIMAAR